MNVYQLMPTPCYDDDDDGCWDLTDGQSSRIEFYTDDRCDSEDEQTGWGWYSVVGGTAAVPPAPRLMMTLDTSTLKFFDDDDSSADNETFFGRTLDTISEEDEEDEMERVAVINGQRSRRSTDLSKLAPIYHAARV